MKNILGIDPGFARCGWAILKGNDRVVDFGLFETSKKHNEYDRFKEIYIQLKSVIDKYNPDTCGIEKIFFNKNVNTALPVSQIIGLIKGVLIENNINYFEYTPIQVKKALTGYGRSSKGQIENFIKKFLIFENSIEKKLYDDAFDAIAVALCHSFNIKSTFLQKG